MKLCYEKAINDKREVRYEKPVITKQTKMTFPIDIIETKGSGVVCKQCSSCHSCR